MDYATFLESKAQAGAEHGFAPLWMPNFLMDFQAALLEWKLRKGRGAIFADCGLGKTPMELVWAENVVRKTNGRVLILTPLAVAAQFVREGEKFGVGVARERARITVANIERLHHYNARDYAGVVVDESSILKSFDGEYRRAITEFLRVVPYRLLATATAAPNDYIELGTSSEALGELGHMDMLSRFFKNDQNTIKPMFYRDRGKDWSAGRERVKWRFKGHAEAPFWRWVCTWARACRKPSDLGFDDGPFILPPLIEREHIIEARTAAPGMLFNLPAVGFREEREERRRTITERCELAAALVADTGKPYVIWCHLNDEGKVLAHLLPDAIEVNGSDSTEAKEEAYEAFAAGHVRGIVTKPKIGAWGLNWPHCAHVVSFASHSYEQFYQAVRRCWRFGQKNPVTVDLIATEGERGIKDNLRRKSAAADRMFSALVEHMNAAMGVARGTCRERPVEVPRWL